MSLDHPHVNYFVYMSFVFVFGFFLGGGGQRMSQVIVSHNIIDPDF
jgi:hypothetical protein